MNILSNKFVYIFLLFIITFFIFCTKGHLNDLFLYVDGSYVCDEYDTQELCREYIKESISKGANVNLSYPKSRHISAKFNIGLKPIHLAVINGNLFSTRILIENGADIDIKDTIGITPLMYAIWLDKNDITKYLIDNGANVNLKSIFGHTPLIIAAYKKNLDIVRLLIERGADVNAVASSLVSNDLIFFYCKLYNPPLILPIIYTSKKDFEIGYNNITSHVLAQDTLKKWDFNERTRRVGGLLNLYRYLRLYYLYGPSKFNYDVEKGFNALMFAIHANSKDIAIELVNAKTDLSTKEGIYGKTALMLAAERNDTSVINLLLNMKANTCDEDFTVIKNTKIKMNSFLYAVINNCTESIEMLMKRDTLCFKKTIKRLINTIDKSTFVNTGEYNIDLGPQKTLYVTLEYKSKDYNPLPSYWKPRIVFDEWDFEWLLSGFKEGNTFIVTPLSPSLPSGSYWGYGKQEEFEIIFKERYYKTKLSQREASILSSMGSPNDIIKKILFKAQYPEKIFNIKVEPIIINEVPEESKQARKILTGLFKQDFEYDKDRWMSFFSSFYDILVKGHTGGLTDSYSNHYLEKRKYNNIQIDSILSEIKSNLLQVDSSSNEELKNDSIDQNMQRIK